MRGLRTFITAPLAFAVLTVPLDAAHAQGTEPETVPTELVRALIAPGMLSSRSAPDIRVGELPPDLRAAVPWPSGIRVLGSLVGRDYATAVVVVPEPAERVRADWPARLEEAGWSRVRPPSHGGFESQRPDHLQFCMGDTTSLNLAIVDHPSGGALARLGAAGGRRSACGEPPSMFSRQSLIPSLTPPDGVGSLGSGVGGGSDHWEARARLETSMTPPELIDHYAAQLRAGGWVPADRLHSGTTAVQTFRVTDDEGAAWLGVLTAIAPEPDADRVMNLTVVRIRP